MITLCCKVVPINNFQRQSCSSNCLEGNRENIFEIDAYLRFLQRIQCRPSQMRYVPSAVYVRNGCIFLCVFGYTPLESLLNGLSGYIYFSDIIL